MPSKKQKPFDKKAFLKIMIPVGICVALFVVGAALLIQRHEQRRDDSIGVVGMSQVLSDSLRSLARLAPTDPKTGASYFPALQLYIEQDMSESVNDFTYQLGDDVDEEGNPTGVQVSRASIVDAALRDFHTAQSPEDLFKKLPKAQACARGVTIVTTPLEDLGDRKLHHKQTLDDGRVLYFYHEPQCPELNELAFDLGRIKSY